METQTPRGQKILVVDDQRDIRDLLCARLAYAGYQPVPLPDGAAVLEHLEHNLAADLVLLDIMMPGMSGYEVLQRIRARFPLTALPVIILSARDGGEEVIRAFHLGANDYVIKPMNWDLLQGRIRTHLALKEPTFPMLGPYRVLRKIGSGGMGMVYEGQHVEDNRRYALKVLPRALTYEERYVRRFLQEAELAARVDHPNVVKMHGASADGETYYIVMELVEGQDLEVISRTRRFSPGEALRITRQVASGLMALAEAGVIHRDIKPENVIISYGGQAKITDLGIARALDNPVRLTDSGIGLGSMVYASPEQIHGEGDLRTDIYSLGCTLFFLLTGHDPFPGDKGITWVADRKRRAPPLASAVDELLPRRAVELAQRMMRPDPRDRFPGYQALIAAIDAALDSDLDELPQPTGGRWLVPMAIAVVAGAAAAWLLVTC